MKRTVFILASITSLFCACSEKTDITADWQEIPVIYGLLNPYDSIQYIRINRAFLGDGDATVMAGVADSINYTPGDLDVNIQRIEDGSLIHLTPDLSLPKNAGTFANVPNILYKTTTPIQKNSNYQLVVKNIKSGKTATAKTPTIDGFSVSTPSANPLFSIDFTNNAFYRVKWISAKYGKLYNLTIRFHYREVDKNNTADTTDKYLDWSFPDESSTSTAGGETMELPFTASSFYTMTASKVKPDINLKRVIGKLDFMFTVASEELNNYININKPSTGIVQDKPLYTNITGGIGIFSSRYTQVISNKILNQASADSLCRGSVTGLLGFCDPSLPPGNACSCN